MITKSIKAPGFVSRLLDHFPNQQVRRHTLPPLEPRDHIPKDAFIRLVESAKLRFPKGMLVTFLVYPPEDNKLPTSVYRVSTHNELHKNCAYDTQAQEPRCVFCTNIVESFGNYGFHVGPSKLRALTEAEMKLVNLQNQSTQGTA